MVFGVRTFVFVKHPAWQPDSVETSKARVISQNSSPNLSPGATNQGKTEYRLVGCRKRPKGFIVQEMKQPHQTARGEEIFDSWEDARKSGRRCDLCSRKCVWKKGVSDEIPMYVYWALVSCNIEEAFPWVQDGFSFCKGRRKNALTWCTYIRCMYFVSDGGRFASQRPFVRRIRSFLPSFGPFDGKAEMDTFFPLLDQSSLRNTTPKRPATVSSRWKNSFTFSHERYRCYAFSINTNGYSNLFK